MGSFIVEFWSRVFHLPQYISPHWWIKRVFPGVEDSYKFVDTWVLGHFFGAILLYLTTASSHLRWLESIAVLYGGLMVVEALFYEMNLLVFAGYQAAKTGKPHRVLSHRRLVITSLQNYATMIFWFALFYRHWQNLYKVEPFYAGDQILTWLALSFKTMTGFGQVSVEAQTLSADALLLAQAAIGVSMALLIVVSFVRLLPKPGTRDYWESSTLVDDEQSLVELAEMGKDGNMARKHEAKDAFDLWCSLAAATLALRMTDAIKREKPPDAARSYALTAIIGALSVGALCLAFAYHLFSSGTVVRLHQHTPIGAWTVGNACPGCIFLLMGFLLVLAAIVVAVCAARSITNCMARRHELEKERIELREGEKTKADTDHRSGEDQQSGRR
jgi:hypothetical protein